MTASPHAATPGDSTDQDWTNPASANPASASPEMTDDAEATALRRTLALTQVHDWCLERLSELSLAGQMPQARALTAEHLELLEVVSQRHTLWMVTEADG